jgi:hypothetical protein
MGDLLKSNPFLFGEPIHDSPTCTSVRSTFFAILRRRVPASRAPDVKQVWPTPGRLPPPPFSANWRALAPQSDAEPGRDAADPAATSAVASYATARSQATDGKPTRSARADYGPSTSGQDMRARRAVRRRDNAPVRSLHALASCRHCMAHRPIHQDLRSTLGNADDARKVRQAGRMAVDWPTCGSKSSITPRAACLGRRRDAQNLSRSA